MGIEEVVCAPRSPWQNPYCERLIGSIRREVSEARRPSVSSQLILRAGCRVPLLLSSVHKRAEIVFRTAQEQWHTRNFVRNGPLEITSA